jgi:hypothetical protein
MGLIMFEAVLCLRRCLPVWSILAKKVITELSVLTGWTDDRKGDIRKHVGRGAFTAWRCGGD